MSEEIQVSRHNAFYQSMDSLQQSGLSTRVANDVLYLRLQERHTPELEQRFIQDAKSGVVPDVTQYG